MFKQTVVYPHSGKWNKPLIHATTWVDLKGITLVKSSSQKVHSVSFYLYNILKITEYRDKEKINGFEGIEKG